MVGRVFPCVSSQEQAAPLDPYAAVSQMGVFTIEPDCIRSLQNTYIQLPFPVKLKWCTIWQSSSLVYGKKLAGHVLCLVLHQPACDNYPPLPYHTSQWGGFNTCRHACITSTVNVVYGVFIRKCECIYLTFTRYFYTSPATIAHYYKLLCLLTILLQSSCFRVCVCVCC